MKIRETVFMLNSTVQLYERMKLFRICEKPSTDIPGIKEISDPFFDFSDHTSKNF